MSGERNMSGTFPAEKTSDSGSVRRTAGQDVMSYEETEKGEDKAFMDYCRECCPDLYSILGK